MRIRDPIVEAEEPFNFVPLTDMVFNLLIFFMAATTFAQVERELSVNLPRATASAGASAVPKQLVINVTEAGKAIVYRKTYDEPAGLTGVLKAALTKNPDAAVIVRADERATVKHLAAVLEVCKQAGVKQANLSYVTGGGGAAAPGAK
jgi:biopolymer transport protein ExbD